MAGWRLATKKQAAKAKQEVRQPSNKRSNHPIYLPIIGRHNKLWQASEAKIITIREVACLIIHKNNNNFKT